LVAVQVIFDLSRFAAKFTDHFSINRLAGHITPRLNFSRFLVHTRRVGTRERKNPRFLGPTRCVGTLKLRAAERS